MTPLRSPRLVVPALILLSAVLALGDDGNPPRSRTGAAALGGIAAESTCRNCHGGNALNTDGGITLVSPPAYYVPGNVYTLTVRLASTRTAASSGRLWGFQLTAVEAADGTGAGTLANVTGQGTMVVAGTSSYVTRQYIEVNDGHFAGAASPVSWQVQWTAPDPGVGDVHFYFSGVAADGGGGDDADWVYTGSHVMPDQATPTLGTTWGRLKARYRR